MTNPYKPAFDLLAAVIAESFPLEINYALLTDGEKARLLGVLTLAEQIRELRSDLMNLFRASGPQTQRRCNCRCAEPTYTDYEEMASEAMAEGEAARAVDERHDEDEYFDDQDSPEIGDDSKKGGTHER